jgi:cytochrome c5
MDMKKIAATLVLGICMFACGIASAGGDAKAGEAVYNRACKMCHDSGMMGAPKTGDKAAWAARIKQGADILTKNTITGLKAMPARGSCASCSDDDIANAVAYLISKSK